jgi:tetratricopeptide (TPR) repeat protein
MGGLAEYDGDVQTAEKYYRKAIEVSPSYVTGYIWLALLSEYGVGQPLEAIRLYEKALELDPVMVLLRTNLATVLSAVGRHEEAMQVARDALDINATDGFMRSVAGELVAVQYGRLADAVAWSQRAAQLESRYNAGVAWNYVSLGDLDSARPWHEQYKRDFPNGASGPSLSIEYFRASGAQQEAAAVAEELLGHSSDTFQLDYPLKVIRDYLIDSDRIEDAIDKYRQYFPELFLSEPQINNGTISAAIDLVLLLKLSGQNNIVDTLAAGCFELMQTMPRMAIGGIGLEDVELHALLGNRDAAIESLAEAVAEGYTDYHDPLRPNRNFENIQDDPEFKRLMGIIQDRVAAELAKVREMEQAGRLARTPEELDGIQFDLSL